MDRHIKNIMNGVVSAAIVSLMYGCAAETPWEEEGTGTVRLHTSINSITTRAEDGNPSNELADNCVVRISRHNGNTSDDVKIKDGLIYKATGLKNVKEKITLNAGNYVAEAYAGDSVPASFESKYFKAYMPFEVTKNGVTTVTLNCKIQNTIVMIDNTDFDKLPMKDYTITVTSSEGAPLTFQPSATESENTIFKKGYFMMPEEGTGSLTYTISGTKTKDNETFTYTGTIKKVKRTWTYKLKFNYNPTTGENPGGSSFIDIKVDDEAVNSEKGDVTIPSAAPGIEGVGFTLGTSEDNAESLDYTDSSKIPSEIGIKVCAVGDIKTLSISGSSLNSETPCDLLTAGNAPAGISLASMQHDEDTNVTTAFILINNTFITGLTTGQTHTLTITATDDNNKTSSAVLKITR